MQEAERIKSQLQDLLQQHLRGHRGHIGQKQYKDDFFALFRRAYEGGYMGLDAVPKLTEDALRDSLNERWVAGLDATEVDKARELLEDMLVCWGEWTYAWDQR